MFDRRRRQRTGIDFFFNKYIGGYPHLCRAVDISANGIRAVVINEPATAPDAFPLELRVPGDSRIYWLWGRRVRSRGRVQSIEFTSVGPDDAHRLELLLRAHAA
jgi:hypothetical protein